MKALGKPYWLHFDVYAFVAFTLLVQWPHFTAQEPIFFYGSVLHMWREGSQKQSHPTAFVVDGERGTCEMISK